MDETDVASHLEKVISTANSFTKLFDRAEEVNQAMASHQIFVVRPTDTSRQARTLEFASFHVLGFVSRAYANLDHLMRETFYKQISGHTWFGASVGRIFETSVLLWLRHAPQGTSLPCHPAKAEYPVLNIPVCRENIAFFSNVVDLGKVDQNETGLCLVLASQTFPSMDTIIITEESVITVQMTIAHTHDAKPSGFRDVYRSFTDEFRSKNRGQYYVFLTDTEDKAALLRNQTQVDQQLAKMGIQLYSAFIEFGKLDLIITSERVNGLETERVSSYFLYVINIYRQSCRIGSSRKWIQRIKIVPAVTAVPLRKHFAAEVLFLNRVRLLPVVPVREQDENVEEGERP